MPKNNKQKQLQSLKPRKYKIYGIFNFRQKKLVNVDLDMDKVLFEFDLAGYSEESHDIVAFEVLLA
jgi:hypothetical protein